MSGAELPELFERAAELEGTPLEEFLDSVERDRPGLGAKLRRMLAVASGSGSILDRELPEFGDDEDDRLPERVGPYRIVREIGRGGMGRVYLAEHSGGGFVRRVALKRLDRRRVSPIASRRFADEVRILAGLEHSGIARFLDGGHDPGVGSYLVLEFVEGEDLVAHARQRNLDLEARLRLFREVLTAVDYAHSQRVIHRDLKPGNILVGADGRPKLLDFGIAKLLEPEVENRTATRTELRALTPAYASPEQIRGGTATIASDVYSLGVLLYELIAGRRPFDSKVDGALALERAVLEEEPEPPSTAARRRPPAVAAVPMTAPLRLGRDLDAICLMALRKEPERRYASAAELAEDLDRFLAGSPVLARRGGFAYRVGKRFRRHGAAFTGAAAAAMLAALAVLGWTWSRSSGVRPLPHLAPPPASTLDRLGALSTRFAEHPQRVDYGLELARALLDAGRGVEAADAVTRLRQLPGALGRGTAIDLVEAEAALATSEFQRALAAAAAAAESAAVAGDGASERRARLVEARALLRLGSPAEVERRLDSLAAAAEVTGDGAALAESLYVRADAARKGARAEEARSLLDGALARAQPLGLGRLEVELLILRSRLQGEAGEIEAGLTSVRAARDEARTIGWLWGEGSALSAEAALLNWKGDAQAAHELLPVAAEKLRQSGNREVLLTVLGNLATSCTERAELAAAETAISEAERLAVQLAVPRARARVAALRAYLAEQRGDYAQSRAAYDAAISLSRGADAATYVAKFLSELAWLEATEDHPDLAEAPAREAIALHRKGGDERAALEVEGVLAWIAAARGDRKSALRHIERLHREAAGSDSESARYVLLVAEAKILEALSEIEPAIALRERLAELAKGFGNPSSILAHRLRVAELRAASGQARAARELAAEVLVEADRLGLAGIARGCRRLLERQSDLTRTM
jgi:tRNA A-37 threonylcarbamoyl transferase component Bud32